MPFQSKGSHGCVSWSFKASFHMWGQGISLNSFLSNLILGHFKVWIFYQRLINCSLFICTLCSSLLQVEAKQHFSLCLNTIFLKKFLFVNYHLLRLLMVTTECYNSSYGLLLVNLTLLHCFPFKAFRLAVP